MTAAESRPSAPGHLVVGHIARPHGTRGELYVSLLTDRPDVIFAPGRVLLVGDTEGDLDAAALEVEVAGTRLFKRGLLLSLAGREDRSAVEPLVGRYLLAAAEALAPREAGEVFYHELLGLRVETVEGVVVGTVREVFELAPADLLEVKGADGRVHLVPFAASIVKVLDVAAGRLVIDPPAGLLEL